MQEALIRSAMLLGEEAMDRLAAAHVAVFGLGGVGSFCAEALARSGVGALTLVDDDTVAESNLNRQLIALHSTLGRPKAEVMAERIRDIAPQCRLTVLPCRYTPETRDAFFQEPLHYMADCIDSVACKTDLIATAISREIPILSAMGTGNKLHPELFEIADIYETSVCPLCRVMRRELKNRGIPGLRVVYSREKPISAKESPKSAPSADENADPERMGTEKRQTGRPVPGSVSFVPPVAGLLMAGEVIRELSGINEKQK